MEPTELIRAAKYILFEVGGELYGTPLLSVREVVEYKAPKPIPNAARGFEGVINLRGEIMGVIDLRTILELPRPRPRCLLILENESGTMGVAIDRVISVTEIHDKDVELKNGAQNTSVTYFLGIAKIQNYLVTLLELRELMQNFTKTA